MDTKLDENLKKKKVKSSTFWRQIMLIKQEKKGKFLIFENSWTIKLIEI